ncbi:hypothetical protein CCACVL1_04765 [Corchorus capsularis]|uniref:Uncharacterized protein n=1 Tax=Corchorus capsularis TaxID=210143 RepID=A0A1R3JPU8_COCAP|nr:hypothetical protein CCACVL1_04765 [Corchorus capsularis]
MENGSQTLKQQQTTKNGSGLDLSLPLKDAIGDSNSPTGSPFLAIFVDPRFRISVREGLCEKKVKGRFKPLFEQAYMKEAYWVVEEKKRTGFLREEGCRRKMVKGNKRDGGGGVD